MSSGVWKIAGASVAGFSHQDSGAPCQDAHEVAVTANSFFIGVVCDGAGSAPRSVEGAREISGELVRYIAEQTITLPNTAEFELQEPIVREWVELGLLRAREQLTRRAIETNGSLSDFHATMVGAVAGVNGGVFFHIGDGAACAARVDDLDDAVLSTPENGEYANETFFVTQEEWREHLRLISFGPSYNMIALMSDGVTPFALASGGAKPFRPFFEPLSKHLAANTREDGERALGATFQKVEIRKITGDDKTLLWALKDPPK